MSYREPRLIAFIAILLSIMTLSSVAVTLKTFYPDGNPAIDAWLERKAERALQPVAEGQGPAAVNSEICVWLKTYESENARCVEPNDAGQIVVSLPGPEGQSVGVIYQEDEGDLRITITPPGAFPTEDE